MVWSYLEEVADLCRPHGLTISGPDQLKKWLEETEEHVGVVVTDKDSNIVMVNNVFVKATGYTPAEVIGKNPRMLQSGEHDHEYYRNMWNSLLDKGHWGGLIWDRRKDGGIYPEWLSISVLENEVGEPLYYIASFMVCEKKALYNNGKEST
ncbi:PAS domain S-box protein [Ammoniphilus sp. YIM 78166]|uniref:PAS domain-containing protein n=1 Tax=Ammoniphilus sp. YIM 78166 TaxID=1644106 RepID=UPI001432006B|nr:PAS domain S-box protein [Ammoniphilus sp. YIM 78166]